MWDRCLLKNVTKINFLRNDYNDNILPKIIINTEWKHSLRNGRPNRIDIVRQPSVNGRPQWIYTVIHSPVNRRHHT